MNFGWCISGGYHSHLLRKRLCSQKKEPCPWPARCPLLHAPNGEWPICVCIILPNLECELKSVRQKLCTTVGHLNDASWVPFSAVRSQICRFYSCTLKPGLLARKPFHSQQKNRPAFTSAELTIQKKPNLAEAQIPMSYYIPAFS
jgi:hypothetical protein